MIINITTQIEMYKYILSDVTRGIKNIDNNTDDFISILIRDLAFKLFNRSSLYIGKINISKVVNTDFNTKGYKYWYKRRKLKKEKNYKCKSNQLIYYVLSDFPECEAYITDEIQNQLVLKCPEDFENVRETGTKARRKLIKLCKQYLMDKDMELVAKTKSTERYNLAKEDKLAEAAIGKYYEELLGHEYNVKTQMELKKASGFLQGLHSDVVIRSARGKSIIIDVKVYNVVGQKSKHGKFVYSSNANRYQVNSYIGAFKNKFGIFKDVTGVLLHVVDDELWNENKELQGIDVSIEDSRPIYLYMVKATDWENMKMDCEHIIKEVLMK